MEIRDGFVLGIYNYCDRWCGRCALTNRCRVFADIAEIEFEEGNGPLTEAKRLRGHRRLATGLQPELAEAEADDHAPTAMPADDIDRLCADLEASSGPDAEVVAGGSALRKRLRALHRAADPTVRDAIETIQHFTLFVPLKMMRALSQVRRGDRGGQQSDANGSGKAALLGLERMTLAWQTLVNARSLSAREAAPFLAEIARMRRTLDRALPDARAFVRPGFDEPDEIKRLERSEWSGLT
jgi:hypothetical protein